MGNSVSGKRSSRALPRIVFAGDRKIAVEVLTYLRRQGVRPLGLMLPEKNKASHAQELISLCRGLKSGFVWYGQSFCEPNSIRRLQSLNLDYIVCIHFPVIVPPPVLNVPRIGVLNLHPAYLPYNRGWHNAVWALLEKTLYGATLHFMNEKVDAGDIVNQRQLEVRFDDTGNSLYRRAMRLELKVFKEAWPKLANLSFVRQSQDAHLATTHKKKDLFVPGVQEIKLESMVRAGDLLDKIRALTTNRIEEASYFVAGGKRYRIQIKIVLDRPGDKSPTPLFFSDTIKTTPR